MQKVIVTNCAAMITLKAFFKNEKEKCKKKKSK